MHVSHSVKDISNKREKVDLLETTRSAWTCGVLGRAAMSISARGFEQRILQVQKSTAFGESKHGSFITKTCGVDDARLKTSVSTPSTEG